jgi:putative protein kinase ArgK-like GTPase of G3E family
MASPQLTQMNELYDVILLETVGVGQSETNVADCADTVVFCVQPGSGDSLQFMKAGIVEIPHLVVVTKIRHGRSGNKGACRCGRRARPGRARRLASPDHRLCVRMSARTADRNHAAAA